MAFVLNDSDMARIQLVEQLTHAKVKDCIDQDDDKIVVIVHPGSLNQALGKNASNLRSLEAKFKKKFRVVEFSDDPSAFLKNLCRPNKVVEIQQDDKTYTIVPQDIKSRGYMIGRGASVLRFHEKVMQRYFDVTELKVAQAQEL